MAKDLCSSGFFLRKHLGPFLHGLNHLEAFLLFLHLLLDGLLDWRLLSHLCSEPERFGGLGMEEECLLALGYPAGNLGVTIMTCPTVRCRISHSIIDTHTHTFSVSSFVQPQVLHLDKK